MISHLIFGLDIRHTVFITATRLHRGICLSFLLDTCIVIFTLFLVTFVIFWLNWTFHLFPLILLPNHFGPLKLHLYHILQIICLWTPHSLQLDILIVLLISEFRQFVLDFVRVFELALHFDKFWQGCSRLWGGGDRVGWRYLRYLWHRSGFFKWLRFFRGLRYTCGLAECRFQVYFGRLLRGFCSWFVQLCRAVVDGIVGVLLLIFPVVSLWMLSRCYSTLILEPLLVFQYFLQVLLIILPMIQLPILIFSLATHLWHSMIAIELIIIV